MSLARAIATVGGFTMLSRIAGFARDILTAALIGAGPVADAFFVALKLPNLFRRIFAEGAFGVSFVPLFTKELHGPGGQPAAKAFAEEALAGLVAILLPLTVLAVIGMPWVVTVIAPGFTARPETFALAVDYARATFPYLMLISLASLFGGVLNAVDRFAPFAAAPILFNLTIIGGLFLAAPLGLPIGNALSQSVAAAGILQLALLAWSGQRAGFALRLHWPRWSPRLKLLLRRMTPGLIGAGAMQINLFFDILIASLLPTGAISYLYYADRLYQLPLGVIGVAIGTALLPALSRHIGQGATNLAESTQNRATEAALLLALPATATLIVLPFAITRVLFERGAFGPAETAAVALAIAAFAIGIPAYVMTKVLSAAYFARGDTATPVKIAILCAVANVAVSFALIGWLAHVGIALATGLTAWLNAGLLAVGLIRRGQLKPDAALRRRLPRILLATAGMAVALLGAAFALEAPLAQGRLVDGALALTAVLAAGAVVYGGLLHATGAARLSDLRALRRNKPA